MAFYNLENVLYLNDLKKVYQGIKEFNLTLLKLFNQKGLKEYQGTVYTPFGNNIKISDIINKINNS